MSATHRPFDEVRTSLGTGGSDGHEPPSPPTAATPAGSPDEPKGLKVEGIIVTLGPNRSIRITKVQLSAGVALALAGVLALLLYLYFHR